MKIAKEALDALKAAHPRGVKMFEVLAEADAAKDGAEVDQFVFRVIDRAAHTKYRALNKRSTLTGGGGDEPALLAKELLVWPADNGVAFDALRDRAPAVAEEIGHALLADADGGLMVREGKL